MVFNSMSSNGAKKSKVSLNIAELTVMQSRAKFDQIQQYWPWGKAKEIGAKRENGSGAIQEWR